MRSSKHQEDFGHVLGNQNRLRVSFGHKTRGEEQTLWFLEGKCCGSMLFFYSITTESLKSIHDYCLDLKPCLSKFVKRDQVLQTLFNPLSKLC